MTKFRRGNFTGLPNNTSEKEEDAALRHFLNKYPYPFATTYGYQLEFREDPAHPHPDSDPGP